MSGCIEKYISPVKMYKKIHNRKIELKKDNMLYITSNVMFRVYEILGIFYSFQPLIFTLL